MIFVDTNELISIFNVTHAEINQMVFWYIKLALKHYFNIVTEMCIKHENKESVFNKAESNSV